MRYFSSVILIGLLMLGAACGQSATDDATDAAPPDNLAISDLVADVVESTSANEALDDLCRRAYADAPLSDDVTVGLVADVGSIDDGTFNHAAFQGMEAAGRCFGVNTTFLESAGDDSAEQIKSLVDREVDVIITVGFQFQEATVAAANDRPDLRFIGVDQTFTEGVDNYVAVSFRDDQVGFLAGAAAALLTESGTVAVVAGPDSIPPVVAIADGFEMGARSVSPDVTVLRQHLDSFVDSPAGTAQAEIFLGAGADVLFGAAGESGASATRTAAASGAWVIGVDQDEYYTNFAGGAEPNADRLATSAIKRVDLGVFLTIAALTTAEVQGGDFLLDAANGGVTYAPFNEADVPDDVAEGLEQARLSLVSDETPEPATE